MFCVRLLRRFPGSLVGEGELMKPIWAPGSGLHVPEPTWLLGPWATRTLVVVRELLLPKHCS